MKQEWKQGWKKYDRITKLVIAATLISALGLILIISSGFINLYNNQDRLNIEESKIIVHESSETSVVKLCIVDKWIEFHGFTGMFNKYILVLSNDMPVCVKKSEFSKYEKDKFYDFTVTKKTTVSQWVTTD